MWNNDISQLVHDSKTVRHFFHGVPTSETMWHVSGCPQDWNGDVISVSIIAKQWPSIILFLTVKTVTFYQGVSNSEAMWPFIKVPIKTKQWPSIRMPVIVKPCDLFSGCLWQWNSVTFYLASIKGRKWPSIMVFLVVEHNCLMLRFSNTRWWWCLCPVIMREMQRVTASLFMPKLHWTSHMLS